MSNQEAIEAINVVRNEAEWNYCTTTYQQAFDMAIEALEFQAKYDCADCEGTENCSYVRGYNDAVNDWSDEDGDETDGSAEARTDSGRE